MRNFILALTLAFLALLPCRAQEPLKIATVGNSITYGAFIANRDQYSYPAQLQHLLGDDDYIVENFGVSATTLSSKGDNPYIKTGQYKASLAFNPDVVLIKLGTNDGKDFNRENIKGTYKADYQRLIDTYAALSSEPRIILITPLPCYLTTGVFAGVNKFYEQMIIPAIEELAYENDLEVIDLYHLFGDNCPEYLMPDRLHPSALGAWRMAERIEAVVTMPKQDPALAQKVTPDDANVFNFHGYQGYEWGNGYKIVEPRVKSNGNQWVLRARFWGHEPQTDQALLERGFHIVYCPVEDLFGAPVAVKRYDDFYAKMVAVGFAPKVVLEGMSRGGLIVYNWAAENPDKVAAIYADAPVMNLTDWPFIKSEGDKKAMMSVYGFKSDAEVVAFRGNPIDKAVKLINIPILHVVGSADDVVSVAQNTDRFKDSLQKAGGFMTVIRKDGVGHHPHSLKAPASIVDFILVSTGQAINRCTVPQPGREWRSGAGWAGGADWWAVSQEISQVLQKPCDVLLLGNSITQGWGGADRKLLAWSVGQKLLDVELKTVLGDSVHWVSAGISGDRTENLLWRLRNGNYEACKARHVFIMIGVNNLTAGDEPQDVMRGIEVVAAEASGQFPDAQITLFGTFPFYDLEKSKVLDQLLLHSVLAANVRYIRGWDWLVDNDGSQIEKFYGGDKLHL